jgi:hypothetical protein
MRHTAHDDPEQRQADRVIEAMETQLHRERTELHWRHCLVIKALLAAQAGRQPESVVAEARSWPDAQAAALTPENPSRPSTPL